MFIYRTAVFAFPFNCDTIASNTMDLLVSWICLIIKSSLDLKERKSTSLPPEKEGTICMTSFNEIVSVLGIILCAGSGHNNSSKFIRSFESVLELELLVDGVRLLFQCYQICHLMIILTHLTLDDTTVMFSQTQNVPLSLRTYVVISFYGIRGRKPTSAISWYDFFFKLN